MRVLFSTYSLAFQNPGGGERVMLRTAEALSAKGHQIDIYNSWKHRLEDYDLIHYFSTVEAGFWQAAKDQAPQIPLVVTPTLWQESSSPVKNKITALLESTQPAWNRSLASRSALPDFWVPTTRKEADSLIKNWGISPDRCSVVPNGVDPSFHRATPEVFRKTTGITESFILHVGRFHPVKNQLRLIRAFKHKNIPLVFIGGPDVNQRAYFEDCREEAASSPQIRFLGALPMNSELIPSAYAAAGALALPSEFETFGLSAFEAVAAGTPRIYVTRNCAARTELGERVCWIDPNELESLAATLEKEWKDPALIYSKGAKISDWSDIAASLLEIYSQLTGKK